MATQPTIGQELLGITSALAPTFARISASTAAKEAAAAKAKEDTLIGQVVTEQNEFDLNQAIADDQMTSLQRASQEVARAREDGIIDEKEQLVIDDFIKQEGRLQALQEQNPTAFSSQKSSIQKKLKFQEALKNNPRLATKLVAARNALASGPGKISGTQVQDGLKLQQEMTTIYGNNPSAAQRVEFSEFKLLEAKNKEITKRNDLMAQKGALNLDTIMTGATADLDLNLTMLDTKFISDQNAGGGFAKSDRVEQYVSQLRLMQKNLENKVIKSVAKQNSSGSRGIIRREDVATQLKTIQDQFASRIEMYQSKDSTALLSKMSEFQKKYLEVNGGNVVQTARNLSGVKGDNMGAMLSSILMMSGGDAISKQGSETARKQSGMERFTASTEEFAVQLSVMMAEGVPMPENLKKAGVYHGILAARQGPINENTQSALLEGITAIGQDSVTDAADMLLDNSASKQLSGPKLKQTVDSLDGRVSLDVRASDRNVSYDKETDSLIVFGMKGKTRVTGNEFIPKAEELSIEERTVVDIDLTEKLNSLYKLRTSGKYASDLNSPADFVKHWTETFNFEPETKAVETDLPNETSPEL